MLPFVHTLPSNACESVTKYDIQTSQRSALGSSPARSFHINKPPVPRKAHSRTDSLTVPYLPPVQSCAPRTPPPSSPLTESPDTSQDRGYPKRADNLFTTHEALVTVPPPWPSRTGRQLTGQTRTAVVADEGPETQDTQRSHGISTSQRETMPSGYWELSVPTYNTRPAASVMLLLTNQVTPRLMSTRTFTDQGG